MIGVWDPEASIPIIGYTQQLNTPADFTVEDDNYESPSSGDPECKSTTGTTDLTIGDLSDSAPNQGFDGGIDTLIKWDRALTETEARAVAEYHGEPGFLVDTV